MTDAQLRTEGISSSILRGLQERDILERCVVPSPVELATANQALTLNAEQALTVAGIEKTLGEFSCHLLEGVTGSGKTEVYLQLIASVLEQHQQVPGDWPDTPDYQTV